MIDLCFLQLYKQISLSHHPVTMCTQYKSNRLSAQHSPRTPAVRLCITFHACEPSKLNLGCLIPGSVLLAHRPWDQQCRSCSRDPGSQIKTHTFIFLPRGHPHINHVRPPCIKRMFPSLGYQSKKNLRRVLLSGPTLHLHPISKFHQHPRVLCRLRRWRRPRHSTSDAVSLHLAWLIFKNITFCFLGRIWQIKKTRGVWVASRDKKARKSKIKKTPRPSLGARTFFCV